MQTRNPLFEDLAKLMTNAAGMASGVREEVEGVVRSQMERLAGQMDLARRDEVDAALTLAAAARTEVDRLSKRVAELEAKLGEASARPAAKPAARARRAAAAGDESPAAPKSRKPAAKAATDAARRPAQKRKSKPE